MKSITLKELNAHGILVLTCKKSCIVPNSPLGVPLFVNSNKPTACYVHYYNREYIYTSTIIDTVQFRFTDFKDAQSMFLSFVKSIED